MKLEKGLTLIELLVAVTVAAILTAIAVPRYADHVLRGKVVEASNNLSEMRVRLEQYFQDNRTYTGVPCTAPGGARYFAYSCPTVTATTYTIRADGVAGEGTGGLAYTIDQGNARATVSVPTGWSGAGSACWVVKKGGTC